MAIQYLNEIPAGLFSDYKQVGSGTYSTIFSALHIKTNTPIALKISLKNDDEDYMKLLYQEISVHKSLNHPFICRYFSDIETDHLLIIVIELIEGTNLLDLVNKTCGLQLSEVQNIFSQLLIAVEYLHNERNISHRDLKLENAMIDNFGHLRLLDFGFSSHKFIMSTICGSIPYCAPEVLECQEYTKEADIWSLGVILYCMISGHLPFYHQNITKLANLICMTEPKYSSIFDNQSKDLISRLLTKDPTQRITLDETKEHAFISHASLYQIDYKQLFSPIKVDLEIESETENEPENENENSQNCEEKKKCTRNIQFVTFEKSNENAIRRTRRFSQVNSIAHIRPANNNNVNNKTSQIKFSNSNPNIGKDQISSCYPVARQKRKLLTSFSASLSSPQFAKLQKIVTLESDNPDHLIVSRKDYPENLNKLIEASLLVNQHDCNCIHSKSHIKLRSSLPVHLQVSNNIYKNINHTLFAQTPMITKPI